MLSQTDWTIDGEFRRNADPDCQAIKTTPTACGTCRLNPLNRDELEPPSDFFRYISDLDNILVAGLPLGAFVLTRLEMRAIILMRSTRQEYELKRLKASKHGN